MVALLRSGVEESAFGKQDEIFFAYVYSAARAAMAWPFAKWLRTRRAGSSDCESCFRGAVSDDT